MALSLEESALEFARQAHEAVNDKRSFSGKPYIEHPIAVAEIVKTVPHTPEMIMAAYLHDVLENNHSITEDMIRQHFGEGVCQLVVMLTNPYSLSDGLTKQAVHGMNKRHLSGISPNAKTIKLADIIHNLSDSEQAPPKYALSYAQAKLDMVGVLREGDSTLWSQAYELASNIIAKHSTQVAA